ncbi:MAG: hypothetical protein RR580_04045 [Christensenellaceae bacterium]
MKKLIIAVMIIMLTMAAVSCATATPIASGTPSIAPSVAPTEDLPSLVTEAPVVNTKGIDVEGTGKDVQKGIAVPSDGKVEEADSKTIISNPKDYVGKIVKIEGTVYGTPKNNQGLLFFNFEVEDGQYMMVSIMDTDEVYKIKAGDQVVVEGMLTDVTSSVDPKDQTAEMPLIAGQKLEVK